MPLKLFVFLLLVFLSLRFLSTTLEPITKRNGVRYKQAIVSIQLSHTSELGCIGAFIASDAIITAAHCFNNIISPATLYINLVFNNGSWRSHYPVRVFVHSLHRPEEPTCYLNDLAIVIFAQAIYHEVPFPVDGRSVKVGEILQMYSYGDVGCGCKRTGRLQVNSTIVVQRNRKVLVTWSKQDNSGGLLLRNGALVGVISSTTSQPAPNHCICSNIHLSTRIYSQIDYIRAHVPTVQVVFC